MLIFITQASSSEKLRGVLSKLYNPKSDLSHLLSHLTLLDLNHALFRCDQEEREISGGSRGVYSLNGYGPMKYAGLQVCGLLCTVAFCCCLLLTFSCP